MLNVIMLSVVIPSVVTLSVVASHKRVTIVIYDRNDSGLYYKRVINYASMLSINLSLIISFFTLLDA
jgi:hypothetical protein